MRRIAKISRNGQITIPHEIRRMLGVGPGDSLKFENDASGVRVYPVRLQSRFAMYRGIGNPGLRSGRKAINSWLRGLRGPI